MRFIGDVHGHIQNYLNKIEGQEESFQVGDMGVGFEDVFLPTMSPSHYFIRGNHDDPAACYSHPNYAGEYGYVFDSGLFFLGGAYSIDQNYRRVHMLQNPHKKIWWPDEEQSPEALDKAYELYKTAKPKIVVTHDCPDLAAIHVLSKLSAGFDKSQKFDTRTGRALSKMFACHQPETWIFGHYHYDQDFTIEGTRFICLGELSHIDLPI